MKEKINSLLIFIGILIILLIYVVINLKSKRDSIDSYEKERLYQLESDNLSNPNHPGIMSNSLNTDVVNNDIANQLDNNLNAGIINNGTQIGLGTNTSIEMNDLLNQPFEINSEQGLSDIHCDDNIISNDQKCKNIICQIEKISEKDFNREKSKYFMFLLPEIIDFLRHIKKNTDDSVYICFLARDCFFLERLYRKMYPNDTNYGYIYCSRVAMYTASSDYLNYINKILNKRKTTLWIDIQGSGDSHVYFFKKYFKQVPPKLFFKTNTLQKKFAGSKFKQSDIPITEEDYQNLYSYKDNNWKVNIGNRDITYGAFYLESLCRAPTMSIIDVNSAEQPIYEKKYEFLDSNLEVLMKCYKGVLENFWITDKIIYRTDFSVNNLNSHKWSGLVALDIDDTVTGDDYGLLKSLCNKCLTNNLKIIFITARDHPFHPYENVPIPKVMSYFLNNYHFNYPIEIWYNPFSKDKPMKEISKIKIIQLDISRREIGLKSNQCMIIDDQISTINLAKKSGFILSTLVSENGKIGINQKSLDNINDLIEISKNQPLIDSPTEPVIDSSTGTVIDSPTEPVIDSSTGTVIDSPTEPVIDSSTGTVIDSPTEPVIDSSTGTVIDSPTEPVIDSSTGTVMLKGEQIIKPPLQYFIPKGIPKCGGCGMLNEMKTIDTPNLPKPFNTYVNEHQTIT